ncbi:hypothetical protein ECG_03745 [Echinococcus granulosus]|uniref:rRNA biogenesis protein RRP36 n=1 Tax=Echinococcus granulosus TaxID=6210 RepID=U6J3Y3_ECHGR|nr:hypothetical protein EGR_04269 [Echinococcus granulosus]EUB60830.1 hypothetical protein EGR_04269 [Echinococcus granulosus]KAH9283859.1 hypothetical protein ECG_03745 [Echinococcus granulosus]CDS17994.1 rRNA biogenesis protein RRP36 [Echinococcus granulosus]
MASCSESGLNDKPIAVPFKQLKKNKFALSNHLERVFTATRKEFLRKKSFRDPRFDPRVNGLCVLSDWTSLKEEQEKNLRTLKKQLRKVRNGEQREKIKRAIKLLNQRRATEKDVELKRRVKRDLQKAQMADLMAGKRATFITRSKLREKVKEERLKSLSKRGKERYLSRQANKKYTADAFGD